MTFEELETMVIHWSRSRGIIYNSTPQAQTLKAVSEMGELADAITKDQLVETMDAIGDILVCLINVAEMKKFKVSDCLLYAFDSIKNRKGHMNANGVFVKEE